MPPQPSPTLRDLRLLVIPPFNPGAPCLHNSYPSAVHTVDRHSAMGELSREDYFKAAFVQELFGYFVRIILKLETPIDLVGSGGRLSPPRILFQHGVRERTSITKAVNDDTWACGSPCVYPLHDRQRKSKDVQEVN